MIMLPSYFIHLKIAVRLKACVKIKLKLVQIFWLLVEIYVHIYIYRFPVKKKQKVETFPNDVITAESTRNISVEFLFKVKFVVLLLGEDLGF